MTIKTYQDSMTEEQLVDSVLDLAGRLGWLRVHFRPARVGGISLNRLMQVRSMVELRLLIAEAKEQEWVTAIQGDKGFVDLVLTNGVKLLFVECKSAKGHLTAEQASWITWLRSSHFKAGVLMWRPEQWFDGTIENVLTGNSGE